MKSYVLAVTMIAIPAVVLARQGWQTSTWANDSRTREPVAAANSNGGAVAAWVTASFAMPTLSVFAARQLVGATSFGAPELVSGGATTASSPDAAVTPAGDAVIVWQEDAGGQWRIRFADAPVAAAWTAPITLSATGSSATSPRVSACGDTVMVMWIANGVVQSRRRAGPSWDPAVIVDGSGSAEAPLELGTGPSCDLTLAWRRGTTPGGQLATAVASSTGAWGQIAVISQAGEDPSGVALTRAWDGVVTAAWRTRHPARDDLRTARRVDGAWSAAATLAVTTGRITDIGVAADPSGIVTLVWGVWSLGTQRHEVGASRLDPGVGVWSVPATVYTSSANPPGRMALAVDSTGVVTFAHGFYVGGDLPGIQTLRFDPVAGQWRTVGSFIGEPSTMVLLPNYGLLLAYLGLLQPGAPAWAGVGIWSSVPGPPAVTATPADGQVTLDLRPAATDTAFLPQSYEYSLDGGLSWQPRVPSSARMPWRLTGLTSGTTYRISVRGVNRAGAGAASPAVDVTPESTVPRAPTDFHVVTRTATALTLQWHDDNAAPPEGFVIEGGVVPGQTLAAVSLGGSARTLTVGLAPGTYFARVHAVRAGVRSAPSNEIRLGVGAGAPPDRPTNLLGLTAGATVALSWSVGVDGAPPEAIRLDVAGRLRGSLMLPPGETFQAGNVPTGMYQLQVTALNRAGASAPSNPVLLDVPASCPGPPLAPEHLEVSASGGRVRVRWDAPAAGPAVERYDLVVSGSYNGTVPFAAREVSAVASGTFTVQVAAVNRCGVSPLSPPQTVVAP